MTILLVVSFGYSTIPVESTLHYDFASLPALDQSVRFGGDLDAQVIGELFAEFIEESLGEAVETSVASREYDGLVERVSHGHVALVQLAHHEGRNS